jgi:hypothetical protein
MDYIPLYLNDKYVKPTKKIKHSVPENVYAHAIQYKSWTLQNSRYGCTVRKDKGL